MEVDSNGKRLEALETITDVSKSSMFVFSLLKLKLSSNSGICIDKNVCVCNECL